MCARLRPVYYKKVIHAILVHEATHAVYDLLKRKRVITVDSEAAAYLAQSIYAKQKWKSAGRPLKDKKDTVEDDIFAIAWNMAGLVLKKQSVPAGDWTKFKSKIAASGLYKKKANKLVGYNG